ncbi:N-methyltransferase tcpN [Cladobotryum mycophilum]|uniref:N-methyltransferase tcpN n=1 Tax=Cladobotryum mycophilum TaxID=491253 RepID=A0ABR0SVX9_9HYPO
MHPKISVNGPQLRVADVGTGTRIWLTDLGKSLPATTQLDGLDISLDAAPPLEYLPSNVTLRKWDVKEPLPKDLTEAYDIVHIRNFTFVLLDSEVAQVVTKLIQLLEPGGLLQWGEAYVASFRIEKMSLRAKMDALGELMELPQLQDARLSPKWAPQLASLFLAAGLEVESDIKDAPPHTAWSTHQCNLMIHEMMASQTGNQNLAKALMGVMPRAASETRDGAYYAFTRHTVIGRKSKKAT